MTTLALLATAWPGSALAVLHPTEKARWLTHPRNLAHAAGIELDLLDTYTLFDQMVANPAAYGFTDVADPAQYSNAPNANQYLFVDADHPSGAAHAQIAALATHSLGITI